MNRDRFLEHGELKGAYYGTSFMTIKRIMESYQIPIIDVHPQVRIMYFLQYIIPSIIMFAAYLLRQWFLGLGRDPQS